MYKIFNHRRYLRDSSHPKKTDAINTAKRWKRQGFLARISKDSSGWSVYVYVPRKNRLI